MMEDKKDVKSLEELVQTANSYGAFFVNLANELSKVLVDIKAPDEEKNTWEMKCPYKEWEEYWYVPDDGIVSFSYWHKIPKDESRFDNGNVFRTKEAAKLESKRRKLLTRFKSFRDDCNGGWKADFEDFDRKYFIVFNADTGHSVCTYQNFYDPFNIFGYFKNESDVIKAIDLFGDEIKKLFIDCECD